MKIAIPERQGRVSPVFDSARHLRIVDVDGGSETARSAAFLSQKDPLDRARHVHRCGVDVLICGAISWPLLMSLFSAGVKVIPFVCGSVEEVVSAFCQNRLAEERYHMPGAGRYAVPDAESGEPALQLGHRRPRNSQRGIRSPKPR